MTCKRHAEHGRLYFLRRLFLFSAEYTLHGRELMHMMRSSANAPTGMRCCRMKRWIIFTRTLKERMIVERWINIRTDIHLPSRYDGRRGNRRQIQELPEEGLIVVEKKKNIWLNSRS
jgi:hypothetical protein